MTWRDIDTGGRVAVISEEFAREIAAAPASALALRIRSNDASEWHEVIGVVQDVHQDGLVRGTTRTVYWPVLTANMFGAGPDVAFVIRSDRAGTVTSSTRFGRR